MMQSLHILRKDTRYLWKEILISLLVTAGFVIFYPYTWKSLPQITDATVVAMRRMANLGTALLILTPVSWLVLVTRCVQAEPLVGKRHFWLTRPYRWQQLLLAKVVFVCIFVLAPFFVSQCLLLMEGGFTPQAYLAGMGLNLLLITLTLILLMLAIAAMSSNFGWTALWLVGILAYIGLIALVNQWLAIPSITVPFDDHTMYLLALVMACIVVVQYARRRVWVAAGLLVSVALVLGGMALFFPTPGMMEAVYRPIQSTLDAPVEINIIPDGFYVLQGGDLDLTLRAAVEISGVMPGKAVVLDNARIVLEGQRGQKLELPWRSVYNVRLLPGESRFDLSFPVKRREIARMPQGPVRVRVEGAFTEIRADKTRQFALNNGEAMIPDFGVCPAVAFGVGYGTGDCRFAMNTPALTYVVVRAEDDVCATTGWIGSLDPELVETGITPVWTSSPALTQADGRYRKGTCPTAVLRLTRYELIRRVRMDAVLDLPAMPKESEWKPEILSFSSQ